MIKIVSDSEEKTFDTGKKIGSILKGGEIIALNGDLGAGKTVFTKGLAAGLGISDDILSPTFTIVHEYSGRLKLNHFDVYRISDPDELYEIGFEEYLGNGVCIIEWASIIEEILPEDTIKIDIERVSDNERIRFINDKRGIINEHSCY